MKKDEFKLFVQKNPVLIKYVKNNDMTWQKFYEMYDMYGEDSEVWNEYINKKEENKTDKSAKLGLTSLSIAEIVKWLKNVDLDGLQDGIGNVQRVLGVVQDFSKKDTTDTTNYKPRPLYKHFED